MFESKIRIEHFMKQLADFIQSKIHIEATDLQVVLSKFKERTVKKGQFILKN